MLCFCHGARAPWQKHSMTSVRTRHAGSDITAALLARKYVELRRVVAQWGCVPLGRSTHPDAQKQACL
eukprot:2656762-Alexandrium_andersonii.AAC.1